MPDEDFLEHLISSLSSPRVHDVHAVIREVPQAYSRASVYGFNVISAGNLSHYEKQCQGYSAEVYQNGTIKIIIDASSKGGLDAEEFNDLFFTIGIDIYPLVMRPLSLRDFQVVELHFNVDKQLTGWAPKFKTITVKTLTGVLLRAYEKKVGGVKKLRVEACGSPDKAHDVLAILNGGASIQQVVYQQQQFIMMAMNELKDYRKFRSEFEASRSMRGPNGADPGHTAPAISSSPPKPLFSPNASRGDTAAPGAPRMDPPSLPTAPSPSSESGSGSAQAQLPEPKTEPPPASGPCPNLKPGAYPHHAWCGKDFQVWNGGPSIDPFPCCTPGEGPGGYESCGFYQNLKRDGLV